MATSAYCGHLQQPLRDTFLLWLEPTQQEALTKISAITNTQTVQKMASKRTIQLQRTFFKKKNEGKPRMAKPLLGEQKAMHDLLKNEKASEGPASIAKEKEHNYSKPSSEVMHTMLTL